MKRYAPHQLRVIAERADLDDKITKLSEFIEQSPVFKALVEYEQQQLTGQLSVMRVYSNVLFARIDQFEAPDETPEEQAEREQVEAWIVEDDFAARHRRHHPAVEDRAWRVYRGRHRVANPARK